MPDKVKEEDVFSALEKTKPSPSNYLAKYIKWFEEFGSCWKHTYIIILIKYFAIKIN